MDRLTSEAFEQLVRIAEPWCVSLLMPTHPSGRETRQDPIRLKNLLKKAEERLVARGRRAAEAREQLAPLRQLLDDATFWAHQSEGLAAYCTPEKTLRYRVPFPVPERATVGRRCYLVPLASIVSEDARFYVLALSPKQVRLLEGTRHTAREAELPGWPEDFAELAAYVEEQSQLQFHTGTPPVDEGGRAAVFHGHPGEDESSVRKQRLREYCRLVDQRVRKAVGDDRAPLVLACEERLSSTYREVTEYPRLFDRPVAGSPDGRKPAELCRQAWDIIRPEVEKVRDEARARYPQAASSGLAAKGLAAVLPAAHEGRIDTLLVAADEECWGHYDFGKRRLDLHERPSPDDEELLNLATVVSYEQGANVYTWPREQLPDDEPALAVLRY